MFKVLLRPHFNIISTYKHFISLDMNISTYFSSVTLQKRLYPDKEGHQNAPLCSLKKDYLSCLQATDFLQLCRLRLGVVEFESTSGIPDSGNRLLEKVHTAGGGYVEDGGVREWERRAWVPVSSSLMTQESTGLRATQKEEQVTSHNIEGLVMDGFLPCSVMNILAQRMPPGGDGRLSDGGDYPDLGQLEGGFDTSQTTFERNLDQ